MPNSVELVRFRTDWARLMVAEPVAELGESSKREAPPLGWFRRRVFRDSRFRKPGRRSADALGGWDGESSGGVGPVKLRLKGLRGTGRSKGGPSSLVMVSSLSGDLVGNLAVQPKEKGDVTGTRGARGQVRDRFWPGENDTRRGGRSKGRMTEQTVRCAAFRARFKLRRSRGAAGRRGRVNRQLGMTRLVMRNETRAGKPTGRWQEDGSRERRNRSLVLSG